MQLTGAGGVIDRTVRRAPLPLLLLILVDAVLMSASATDTARKLGYGIVLPSSSYLALFYDYSNLPPPNEIKSGQN